MLTRESKNGISASEIELNCLLCRKGFQHCEIVSFVPADFSNDNKNTVEYIKKVFQTFDKHLKTAIKGNSFSLKERKKDKMTPSFCKTCFVSAEKLMQFEKQMEEIQRNLEEFINLLSLEILAAKGLSTFAFQNLIRKQNIKKGKDNTNNICNIIESKNGNGPSHSESDVEPFIDTIKPEPVDHNDYNYDYDDEYEGDSLPDTNPPLAHSEDDEYNKITNYEDTPIKVELVEDAVTIDINKNSEIPRSRYLPQRQSAAAALQLIRNNNESKLGSSDSESVSDDEKFTRRKHELESDENNVEVDDYQASFDENEEIVSDNSFEENEEKYEVKNSSEKQPGARKSYTLRKVETVKKDHVNHVAAENTSFPCEFCRKVFKSGLSLNNHLRVHKKKEEFKKELKIGFECQVCQETFKLSKDLLDHSEKMSHKNEKNFSCSECPSSYFRRIDLKYHKRIHDPVRTERYRCKVCQKSFRKSTALKAHQRSHSHFEDNEIIDENLFDCEMCSKAFETNQGLSQHKKATHKDEKIIHECESCGLRFRSQEALLTHDYIHTGEKPFKCEIEKCTSSFTSKVKLKHHFIKNHTNEKPFVCNQPDCDKAFKFKILLDQHILMHIDPAAAKRFVCEMCGKGFAKSEHLRRHRKLHDVNSRFSCEEPNCGKSYNSQANLKEHLKKGHVVKADDKVKKELLCLICGLKCKTPYVLKRHTQTHTGEKLFQCEECGKSFATRGNLTIHKNIAHLGKRYDCEFCEKHFNSKAAVKEHQNIHLRTQQTFLCTICKQDYPDKKALAAHQRTHSDQEKRYKCEKCLTGFTGGTNYKIHISKCKKSIQP